MDDLKPGDIVFLTAEYDAYVRAKNPTLGVVLTNRLAKLEDIIDWNSPRGKAIKDARVESGKWAGLPIEENKYILSVFYPDLKGREGKVGIAERGVPTFRYHPKTGEAFFVKAPDWVFRELMKKCEEFFVAKVPDHVYSMLLKKKKTGEGNVP